MRQSNKKRDATAALYLRLSRDDNLEGESYSIGNQKKLLTKIAKEKGYTNLLFYADDGISGVTMNRAAYIRMIADIENNKISAVFVKDLSRLGRNYIEVGRLTEEFLPEHDVRLVAVSDNIDTYEGENELAPIKNLFNEWYSRDISKKRRISNKIKGNAGEPLGLPPYGYVKDPNGKGWIVDAEAARVVKRIFALYDSGKGSMQIADILSEEKILIPTYYWLSKGFNRGGRKETSELYKWNSPTVSKILDKQEYCGDLINFKTYSLSYKNKKRHENDKENMVIFKNIHEPIIERSLWERVQRKRLKKYRRKPQANGEKNMFSGLLVCADCGSNMCYHFNQTNHDITYFNCSGYNRGKRKICNSTHYIRTDFLEQVMLGEIKRLTKFARKYENEFAKYVMGATMKNLNEEISLKEREVSKLRTRNAEIDILFEKIYEDNALGKINDERFAKLSSKYDDEQKEISDKIERLTSEISEAQSKSLTADMFLKAVRKYTRIKKLTPQILNELVEKIEIFQSEKLEGKIVQKIRVHYNFIGAMDIPRLKQIPDIDVKIHTRQGVDVIYKKEGAVAI